MSEFIAVDLPPLLAALLAATVCGLLGNWLVLRRTSLMGDAISHAILPGIVAAFLITGSRAPIPMFIGALAAAGLTVLLSGAVRRFARVDSGAAMGVVFTAFFALGILLIESAAARQVDLDPDCVLYGSLETLVWFPPTDPAARTDPRTLLLLPTPVLTLAVVTLLAALVLRLLRKEIALASFDPELAAALGFRPTLLHGIVMLLVAVAAIASFEAVGSILVVALLTCPAASARLWSDRLVIQIRLSVAIAMAMALVGYLLAATAPSWLGTSDAISIAGTISVMGGIAIAFSAIASPSHGIVAARLRQRALAQRVAREDLLGFLYRLAESGSDAVETDRATTIVHSARAGLRSAIARGEIRAEGGSLRLTDIGRVEASAIIRRHRLWEGFLADELRLPVDHVHATAERLEHFADAAPSQREGEYADPHGRPIPDPTPKATPDR